MPSILFLKRVLLLDAASCLVMGVLLAAGATGLAPLLGLQRTLLLGAGALLVPIGLFILWIAARRTLLPAAVYVVVAGNLVWVLESLLVLRDSPAITTLGTFALLAQAAAVAALAALEGILVRRVRAPAVNA